MTTAQRVFLSSLCGLIAGVGVYGLSLVIGPGHTWPGVVVGFLSATVGTFLGTARADRVRSKR